MRVTHRLKIAGIWPADRSRDEYELVVRVERTLPVEEILAAAERATSGPAFQETITQDLANELRALVTTVGVHSGVETTCECAPAGSRCATP